MEVSRIDGTPRDSLANACATAVYVRHVLQYMAVIQSESFSTPPLCMILSMATMHNSVQKSITESSVMLIGTCLTSASSSGGRRGVQTGELWTRKHDATTTPEK